MENKSELFRLSDAADVPNDEGADGKAAALRRLVAAGIDPIIPRLDCIVAINLSPPTISRMQGRGELPLFDEISPARKGWRCSVLKDVIAGRRDW